ncbi:hypothetical protein WJX77_002195 [Trebouxia sp. C0004]
MEDGAPVTLEFLATQVKADEAKVNERFAHNEETLSFMRQNIAEIAASVASIAELAKSASSKTSGPTDPDGVAQALRDPAARQKAIKEYGIAWLIEVRDKHLWPSSALHDDDFLTQYVELKKSAKKHPRSSQPSSASARVDGRPKQCPKYNDLVGKPEVDTRVATWSNDSPGEFTCELDGRLKEPLPGFFKEWIDNRTKSTSNGKPLLPQNLLKLGKLPIGHCYYKGCEKAGHRWDQCPRLARHVAKNPTDPSTEIGTDGEDMEVN